VQPFCKLHAVQQGAASGKEAAEAVVGLSAVLHAAQGMTCAVACLSEAAPSAVKARHLISLLLLLLLPLLLLQVC
jgi:hypothetical protein